MNFESSRVTVSVTSPGSVRRTWSSLALTPSTTAIVFSPVARRTSSITAGEPPSHTAWRGRSVVSSA